MSKFTRILKNPLKVFEKKKKNHQNLKTKILQLKQIPREN